jgi:uncharacterized lipoprotein YddW (UPF0748 family)
MAAGRAKDPYLWEIIGAAVGACAIFPTMRSRWSNAHTNGDRCMVRPMLAAFAACLIFAGAASAAAPEYRMLWVDVFHPGLRTPEEADTMVETARSAGYNALIVQVRKACDAYYNSGVEPKNPAVAPGFDPLDHIIARAHDTSGGRRRLEVHAWLVTYRCRIPYDDLYRDPRHVYSRHPEWLNQMFNGEKVDRRGDQAGRYYLDPGVPAVVDYNLEVVSDLLSRYKVDGIHFDYIRYPETEGAGNKWGYNPVAVQRFNTQYGRTGKPDPADAEWCEFRRKQIYFMLRRVYAHVRAWRPQVKVSAALITWGEINRGFERSSAYAQVMQDWAGIAEAGFLDLLIPMNYKRESVPAQARAHREWAAFLGETAQRCGRFGINGVDGESLNTLPDILAQIRATRGLPGIAGIATYCYAQTRRGSGKVPDTEFFEAIRTQVFQRPAEPPEAVWLTRPHLGLVKGVASRGNRQPLDAATVRLGERETLTDGSGFYAFAHVEPGRHTVRLLVNGRVAHEATIEVTAGRVTEAPLAIR